MTDTDLPLTVGTMKLLHLADLHLGRLFHEQSLIEDQNYMLDQVLDILSQDHYTALLMAGDLYDRSIPSTEAVNLFGSFLNTLHSRFPALAIFIIAGNHDSPDRLAFGHELFRSMNIHIVSDPEFSWTPVILEDGEERCAVFPLPFLYPGSLTAELREQRRSLRTQQELVAEAVRRLQGSRQALEAEGIRHSVLLAHLFTLGGRESESERIFIGTAEQVDVRQFAGFSYVALGHLHRSQRVAENSWYAGSPLAYSFGEADQQKVCLEVELPGGSPVRQGAEVAPAAAVRAIPLRPLHPVKRLTAAFAELMESTIPEAKDLAGAYLEIELTDEHLVENAQRLLQQRYPLVLSVKQGRAFQALLKQQTSAQSGMPGTGTDEAGKRQSTLEDFKAFEQTLYGAVDQEKLDLFTTLLEQCNHETP